MIEVWIIFNALGLREFHSLLPIAAPIRKGK